MGASLSVVQMDSSILQRKDLQVAAVSFVASAVLIRIVQKLTSNEKPTPPRPWGFPLIGHLPLMGKEPNVTFMDMREKFGDVFQIRMGSWDTVIVNGKKAIRDVLVQKADHFSGRPPFESARIMTDYESLGFGISDEMHKVHRKIVARLLNEFSSPHKSPLEDMVSAEVDGLLKEFSNHSGKSFDPKEPIFLSVSSVIFQICYGFQENIRETADFRVFLKNNEDFSKFFGTGNPVDVMPWLKYFMPGKVRDFANLIATSVQFRNKMVEEHRQTFSEQNIRDITDGLIATVYNGTILTEKRVIATIDGVFGAGLATVASSLVWILRLMAEHPKVQARVQKELDEVVGNSRRPCIRDRENMVYTEAVLHEVNRFASLAPLNLPYFTAADTELCGYKIKKNSIVITNLYSMSHDESTWGDPHVFRPERFLDSSGQIKKALLEEFIPFSIGRRRCLGEGLAKTEIFLFFTGLLQRCSFVKPPEVKEYSKEIQFGLARQCAPYDIQVKPRY